MWHIGKPSVKSECLSSVLCLFRGSCVVLAAGVMMSAVSLVVSIVHEAGALATRQRSWLRESRHLPKPSRRRLP